MVHIFKYLNPSDLKYAALVCRRFLHACMYKKLSRNFMLNFVDSYYKEFSAQISQFVDTYRVFPTIAVNTGNFDVASQSFWLDYGEEVCCPKELTWKIKSFSFNEIYLIRT